MRVLFVCLGNICRSPSAEAVLRHGVAARGLVGEIEVDSAGTGNWHAGNAPDRRAVAEAERRRVPMSGRARQVTASDLRDFDLVIAMDESNRRDLLAIATGDDIRAKIRLLREWDPEALQHDLAVPDPYYGGERDFAEMFAIIERACEPLLDELAAQIDV
ncbi:MAG: low molecular weight phosphotyrosine protein phosphatase [Solirubrobacteraceae bacterium]|nr:low molecular weight phosphotyrosine protein phosphatase [Solirubrobacteraceae bacterium]